MKNLQSICEDNRYCFCSFRGMKVRFMDGEELHTISSVVMSGLDYYVTLNEGDVTDGLYKASDCYPVEALNHMKGCMYANEER